MRLNVKKLHLKFAFYNFLIVFFIIILLLYAVNAPSKSLVIHVSEQDIKHYKGFSFNNEKDYRQDENFIELVLKKGDILSDALNHVGISKSESIEISNLISKKIDLKKITNGQKITIEFKPLSGSKTIKSDALVQILGIKFKINNHQELVAKKNSTGIFQVSVKQLPLNKKLVRVSNIIERSFFETIGKSDLSNQAIKDITNAFSYDIDFQRDIKKGNKIDLLYEKYYNPDGSFTHTGNVIYASLTLNSNKKYELYRFTKLNGHNIYLSSDGRDTKKDLLKTPINAARISSKFGMRVHPIHGCYMKHNGIDFAARIGTPIYSAGGGIIQEIGFKNGYGRYIKVEHSRDYSTAYGHISKFAKGLKKGDKVKQGEIIAYVGNTGTSTAAHLHFEVLFQGKQINPLKVKSTPGEKLTIAEMKRFNQYKKEISSVIKSVRSETEIAFESIGYFQKIN